MTKNKEATRYYSSQHESSVCRALGAWKQPNSGASLFAAGDVYNKDASLLVECKTAMTDKESFSIKKEWLEKINEERKSKRFQNSCLAFSFGPNSPNFYIIDEKLMKFLVEKLQEDLMENS